MDVEKIIIFLKKKKTFSVSEGALLNTLQLFSAKCFNNFFKHPYKNYFLPIPDFQPKNSLMLSQQAIFYCLIYHCKVMFQLLKSYLLLIVVYLGIFFWKCGRPM